MVIGTPSQRPMIFPLGFADRQVVYRRDPPAHQAVVVKFPVLVTVRTEPDARVVMPFVGEPHSDMVAVERPQLLDQPVVELPCPLALQKRDDFGPADEKLR